MAINDQMNRLNRQTMDFFFPRHCPFCGRTAGKELLCADCKKQLPFTGEQAVTRGTYGLCAAPLFYEGKVKRAIYEYEFNRKTGGLDCFGSLMAQCAAEFYMDCFDMVTWVPVLKESGKKRRLDSNRLLAASMCVDWHIEPVETLRKISNGSHHSESNDISAHRIGERDQYLVLPEKIRGRRFLLINDVLTTGTVLSECVRTLCGAGAANVVCLTLARIRNETDTDEK